MARLNLKKHVKSSMRYDEIAEIEKSMYYHHFLIYIENVYLSRFIYKNVPVSCNFRSLEKSLFRYGKVGFFKTDLGILHANIFGNSSLNFYGENVGYTLRGENGDSFNLQADEIEILRDNENEYAFLEIANIFAYKLAIIEKTIDINIHAQKFPILIACDDNTIDSLKTIYQKYDGNHPVIFSDKSLNPDFFSVLNTNSPYIVDKLRQEKFELMNELLTILGIDNVNVSKKERLITGEVESNNEIISLNLYNAFITRKKILDKINLRWNINPKIEIEFFKKDVNEGKEVEDGKLYSYFE